VTRNSIAASVARNKEAHPERYCPVRGCLWSLRSGPCRKHAPVAAAAFTKDREFAKSFTPNRHGEYA
jgi:hypothetical protein